MITLLATVSQFTVHLQVYVTKSLLHILQLILLGHYHDTRLLELGMMWVNRIIMGTPPS